MPKVKRGICVNVSYAQAEEYISGLSLESLIIYLNLMKGVPVNIPIYVNCEMTTKSICILRKDHCNLDSLVRRASFLYH
jgi:hypothetical protein